MARESIIRDIQGVELGGIPHMRLDQIEGPAYVMDLLGGESFLLDPRTEFRAKRVIGMPMGVYTKPSVEQVSWNERKFKIQDLWSLEGQVLCKGLVQDEGEPLLGPDVRIGVATATDRDFGLVNTVFLLNQIKNEKDWILSRIELVHYRPGFGSRLNLVPEQNSVDKADKIIELLTMSIYGSEPQISRSFI